MQGGIVRTYEVTPEEFGLARAPLSSISGGDAAHNAGLVRAILSGGAGPRRDIVIANAAAALVVAGRATNFLEGARLRPDPSIPAPPERNLMR